MKTSKKFLLNYLYITFIVIFSGEIQAENVLPVYDGLGGEFEMQSTLGKAVGPKDFEGKLQLIYFGYTSCPDICPTTLTVIKQALEELDPSGEQIQVLLITVDPERDSLEKLKIYLEFFNPGFVGLHAPLEDVQKIAKQFGAFFIKDEVNQSAVGYLVTHTGYTYLLDRKSRVRKMFSSKVDVPEMIETVNLLLKP